MKKSYEVKRRQDSIAIDADWNKQAWKGIDAIDVDTPHWPVQSIHLPKTQVKLQYDEGNLYVIFMVRDQYIRAITTQTHGPVYKDSCVEFFFAPNNQSPKAYFNFEVNCCGVMLVAHQTGPRQDSRFLDLAHCDKMKIASSASGPIKNEITKPLSWTVEYAIPFEMLSQYCDIEKPAPAVTWRANFYKCADASSRPHWIAWSPIKCPEPDFHHPEYFGKIEFI
jgi:hypothetical protein